MNFRIMTAAVAAVSMVPLAACTKVETDEAGNQVTGQTTIEALAADDNLSDFAGAFETTGLDGIFDGPAAYTVLAPENGAFGALEDSEEDMSEEERKPVMAAVLRDHILPGALTPDDIKASLEAGNGSAMATMGNGSVTFSLNNEDRIVATGADGRKAILSEAAVRTDNGVVIPVDAVLRTIGETQTGA